MFYAFTILKRTRENIRKAVEGLSLDQLNKIPEGFNNNIFWNVAHVVATQQLLTYGLAGVDPVIPKKYIENYRKGTKPNGPVGQDEVDQIISLLETTQGQIINDILDNKFTEFRRYTTSYGITLNSLEEAIAFNNAHEAMHFGNILSMRKLV